MFGFGADDYFGYKMWIEQVKLFTIVFLVFALIGAYVISFAIGEVSARRKEKLLIKNGFEYRKSFRNYWVKDNVIIDEIEVKNMSYKKLKQRVIE